MRSACSLQGFSLADCYLSLGFSFDVGSVPPREAIPRAKAFALKALALDESLAEAQLAGIRQALFTTSRLIHA